MLVASPPFMRQWNPSNTHGGTSPASFSEHASKSSGINTAQQTPSPSPPMMMSSSIPSSTPSPSSSPSPLTNTTSPHGSAHQVPLAHAHPHMQMYSSLSLSSMPMFPHPGMVSFNPMQSAMGVTPHNSMSGHLPQHPNAHVHSAFFSQGMDKNGNTLSHFTSLPHSPSSHQRQQNMMPSGNSMTTVVAQATSIIPTAQEVKRPPKKRNGKVYECKYCSKSFLGITAVTRHERIHTGEKPFKCTECDRSFRQKGTLRTHMRLHTGHAPLKCKTCGTGFKYYGGLKKHEAQCQKTTAASSTPAPAVIMSASPAPTNALHMPVYATSFPHAANHPQIGAHAFPSMVATPSNIPFSGTTPWARATIPLSTTSSAPASSSSTLPSTN